LLNESPLFASLPRNVVGQAKGALPSQMPVVDESLLIKPYFFNALDGQDLIRTRVLS
jgi:hypothetical protein